MSKAKAEITIYHIIDISKVTRYYKLQSSTASAPGVPTTNPPSGWTTTEPAYTSGSTNTLYFVDLTEFTNGTFKYSAVSKSSSYEAAKAAYNKAVSTEQFVTNHMELTNDGLVVGNLTGETLQGNVLIDTDSVDIRVGDKVSASYQGKNIYLGKDSADAVIDLCDGTGKIENDPDYFAGAIEGDWRILKMSSDNAIEISAPNEVQLYTHTEIQNDDGSSSSSTSSVRTASNAPWYSGTPDTTGGVSLHNYYRKTTYNSSGESPSHDDITSGINLGGGEHAAVELYQTTMLEDYDKTASISLKGKDYSRNVSLVEIGADEVNINSYLDGNSTVFLVNGNRVLGSAKNTNGYWGMLTPEGSDSGWIRTTSSGIIPYSMDSTNGKSSLGSSSWPFANLHVRKVNDTITMDSDGDITIPNGHAYYGTNASGASRSLIYTNSGNNTVIGYGGYANSEGQTNIYGQKVGIYVKTTNGNTSFKPYFEPGDTLSLMCRPVGFITDSKKSVWFDIPLHKIALKCNTVTVTSAYGLIIRHNGEYLYGSSATSSGNTYAKPTKYTADLADGGGIVRIRADFTADSNATNNDPVALIASVTITFS